MKFESRFECARDFTSSHDVAVGGRIKTTMWSINVGVDIRCNEEQYNRIIFYELRFIIIIQKRSALALENWDQH